MSGVRRPHPYVLILLATVAIVAAVTLVNVYQRAAADRAARQSEHAGGMLTAMLDQETGLRGFALVGREVFLEPYTTGRRNFARELAASREDLGGDAAARDLLAQQATAAALWQRKAERVVDAVRSGKRGVGPADAFSRKATMDDFRSANADFQELVDSRRERDLRTASVVAVLFIVLLSAIFAAIGGLMVRRRLRADAEREAREQGYRERQEEFADMLAVADDEEEANTLLKRHIERSSPGTRVVVLNRNNSEDRLEACTPVAGNEPIALALEVAAPRDCLAVRLAKRHDENAAAPRLLQCTICGRGASSTTCVPLLVSGQVIGSVLVEHDGGFDTTARRRLYDSVSQAAPVLANLRNLAMAELRAATDVLTGLPNRRSIQDTIKRMLAQAGRTVTPLSAILIDLDRFKRVNDEHGHERGDAVLAAVGEAIGQAIRASDFAGRNGGEEFLVLLPDTDGPSAIVVAEKLRKGIRAIEVPGLQRPVTASFGVAAFPIDAVDAESLLRLTDRALYLAKHNGRDRVEAATDRREMSRGLDEESPG